MKIRNLVDTQAFDLNCNIAIITYDEQLKVEKTLFNSMDDSWNLVKTFFNKEIICITTCLYNGIPIIVFEI